MSHTNARDEFVTHTTDKDILCAFAGLWGSEALLPVGFTMEDLERFLELLNFEYYDGYGSQHLNGTIWYTDGTWSDRGEYDGSEWWERHECPEIPANLKEAA